jgi:hypothetical protein
VKFEDDQIALPLDPDQIVDNLRCESYTGQMRAERTHFGGNAVIRAMYYLGRPAFPVNVRRILQRIRLQGGTHTPVSALACGSYRGPSVRSTDEVSG